jgi:peptide/nickel transport system ATP-binding protein
MSLMVELSHRMGVMYGGRLVELAPADQILAGAVHPYTRALVDAFPPLEGPRTPLSGLADGVRFTQVPDLAEVSPGHWAAPVPAGAVTTEGDVR